MKKKNVFALALFATLTLICLHRTSLGQTATNSKLANMIAGGSSVRWDVFVSNAGVTLIVSAPDGRVFRKEFPAGSSPEFALTDKQGERLPDGTYAYELRLAPVLSPALKETLKAARAKDDDPEADRAERKRPMLPSSVQSASFSILNGQVIVAGAVEERRRAATMTEQPRRAVISGNTITRLRNHRLSLLSMPDVVTPDDEIIQGSLCVGLDCVNGESFGFDTIRLKENNTRIRFFDTSTAAGFPNNNWQLTANDSNSGGLDKFSIDDLTNSKTPFTVIANAPTNSIFLASTGKIGFGNSSPVLNLHITATDTPAIRQEQTSGGGFMAQTWDIGANEANWFVRDVTNGSLLPLRIRPGAPTSSIDISANGFVGIGTASPASLLHLSSALTTGTNLRIQSTDTGGHTFTLKATGSASNAGVGKLAVIDNTTGGTPFVIDSSGNVGIGTTAPDQKLSVNGDASKAGGGSWQVFSDERLKNIKGSFNSGLKAVMQLQPLRYEYKRNNVLGLKSGREHIGFAAQSVQKVIPEAVSKSENGYLMVNNDPILWTMLNAIKEQQQEIAQLRGQVRQLQAASHRRRK